QMQVGRLEDGIVLEVGKQRQRRMNANVRNRKLAQNAAQMLSRASAARRTVADDDGCFVVPSFASRIQRVLQRACNAVIVFLHDEYESVQAAQLGVPCGKSWLFSGSFAEERQLVFSNVNDF